MEKRGQYKTQVEKIRAEIQRHGESTVSCEQLRALCPEEGLLKVQFERVCDIAQQENWSFTFFPSGEVRFANSSAN